MNTLRTDYNVRVIPEPSGQEVSLEVKPGTAEADVVESAVLAALYQAQEDGHGLTPKQQWEMREPVLALRDANRRVLEPGGREKPASPIMFRAEAAGAVLDGLVALPLEAAEARAQLNKHSLSGADRRAFEPAVQVLEERAKLAEILEAEILGQSAAIGRTAVRPQVLTTVG